MPASPDSHAGTLITLALCVRAIEEHGGDSGRYASRAASCPHSRNLPDTYVAARNRGRGIEEAAKLAKISSSYVAEVAP